MGRRYLVAGNWKMNGSLAENTVLLDGILAGASANAAVEILLCPPAVYVDGVGARLRGSPLQLGGQNLCDQDMPGAFTGEVHGGMLRELGCGYVIVGHSERRALYGESDEVVARKYRAAQACGLVPVLCVGETLQEREANRTEAVLQRQLAAVLDLCGADSFVSAVIAYEPVWAIGTGKTATPEQAQDAHAFIRGQLRGRNVKIADSTRILYGGSVKADNAKTLFANADVDGGLIGGASLKAADFLAICAAAQALSK